MIKYIILPLIFLSIDIDAQNVGIGTTTPQRALDLKGNLKVRSLENKTDDTNYKMIVAKNSETGEVDKITFPSLNQNETKNIEVSKSIYFANSPDDNKKCSCGDITFYIKNSDNKAYIKFNNVNPFNFLSTTTNNFTVGYGVKAFNFYNDATAESIYNYRNITDITFNRATYNSDVAMDPVAYPTTVSSPGSTTVVSTIRTYTISLPKDNYLYKLTLAKQRVSSSQHQYSLICEKFYVQAL